MLSAVKKGKKKKFAEVPSADSLDDLTPGSSAATTFETSSKNNDNSAIAEKLRQSLDVERSENPHMESGPTPLKNLMQQGRITTGRMEPRSLSAVIDTHHHSNKPEEEMTVKELVAQERQNALSWDEQMTRNLIRTGKKRRRKTADSDSDAEVERLTQLLPGQQGVSVVGQTSARAAKQSSKTQQRQQQRLVARDHEQEKVTSKCSWWVESSSFSKHRLLAVGNHCSLVLAPPHRSLATGHHFYLVPLKHAPSFVDGGENDTGLWQEVEQFHNALNKMFAREGKGVILLETVLPHNGFWQTKMEAIPVPFHILQDAPIYFSSAMNEQIDEWGTHNKVLKVTLQRPARAALPKGFPYFCIQWGNVSTSKSTGYAQIIETSGFPKDFGTDTLAAMMEVDPIRFKRSSSNHEEERTAIASFLQKWKKVDFTSRP